MRADKERAEQQQKAVDRDSPCEAAAQRLGVVAGQRQKRSARCRRVHDRKQPGIDQQKGIAEIVARPRARPDRAAVRVEPLCRFRVVVQVWARTGILALGVGIAVDHSITAIAASSP